MDVWHKRVQELEILSQGQTSEVDIRYKVVIASSLSSKLGH
ncbi:MAG TPA: hypothetical protein VJ729_19015 [Nitrososphaeraceae archaeon]|nr:hypothetical protein [Nitrososphaeraceae archaeon]